MQHLEVSGAVRHIYVIRRLKVNLASNVNIVLTPTVIIIIQSSTVTGGGTRWHSLLAMSTSRKVAGSISDSVIGIFH